MARARAKDYDDKRAAILRVAAREFAEGGYDRTSMASLAATCGVSKALLYHYYDSKEALLFDLIRTHLEELIEAVEAADEPGAPPEKRLRALVGALLDAYRDADAEHKVQISALKTLPEQEQHALKALERRLVAVFAEVMRLVAPELEARLVKPATMSLFGMLNWFYLWFREDGPLTREDYADMATKLLLGGVGALGEG